ncbi:7601_t:CDS:1, partial [Racocetra fulgida]
LNVVEECTLFELDFGGGCEDDVVIVESDRIDCAERILVE